MSILDLSHTQHLTLKFMRADSTKFPPQPEIRGLLKIVRLCFGMIEKPTNSACAPLLVHKACQNLTQLTQLLIVREDRVLHAHPYHFIWSSITPVSSA
jgi:hypothetical protein